MIAALAMAAAAAAVGEEVVAAVRLMQRVTPKLEHVSEFPEREWMGVLSLQIVLSLRTACVWVQSVLAWKSRDQDQMSALGTPSALRRSPVLLMSSRLPQD